MATTSLQNSKAVTTDETAYTYNQAGDITSADAIQNPDSSSPVPDLQCFTYNDLQELNQAWTESGSVTPAPPPAPGGPAPGGIGGCNDSSPTAASIGATAAYWDVYGYDALGDRAGLTSHDTASQSADTTANETSQTLAYPGNGMSAAAQPDADTSVTTASPSGTVTTTPGYNPNGNTTSVTATGTAGPLFSAVVPSSGALCLDDHGSATTAGNKIDINTCNGSSAQDWTANSNGTLEVLGNCLDVSGNGTAANTIIVLEPCSTSTAGEIWHPGTRGTWVNPHSGDCLADPGNSATTATQLEIQACSPGTTGQSWAGEQIRYNPQGQVSTVLSGSGAADMTTSYVYDASGNLILQDDNGAVTYYVDGGAEQISYSGATLNGAVRFLTASPDGIVVVRTSAGAVYYELTNLQGTATELISAASDAITRRYYDPYGGKLGAAPSWPDNKGYLGQPADADTGLDLLGARQYEPVTGRFLSLDPVFEAGDPTQMGGYSYAADNPVSQSDPSGLCPAPPLNALPVNCDGSPIPPPPPAPGVPAAGSSPSAPGSSLLPPSARPAYDAFFYGTYMKEGAYALETAPEALPCRSFRRRPPSAPGPLPVPTPPSPAKTSVMPGNTANLQKATAAATARAENALVAMIEEGEPVTFRGLAARAGVSLDFLYRNAGIRVRIERHRASRPARPEPAAAPGEEHASSVVRTLTTQLADLKRRHREETGALRHALEQAHGENLLLRRRLAPGGRAEPGE